MPWFDYPSKDTGSLGLGSVCWFISTGNIKSFHRLDLGLSENTKN